MLSALALAAAVRADSLSYLKDLVRMDTSNPPGNELLAANYLKGKLDPEGIPSEIFTSTGTRASLVARLKGGEPGQALILMCHTDVVPADPKEWSVDPFGAVVKDGFLYGRGTADIKSMCAVEAAVMKALKRSGAKLRRDVVFFAEADEESGGKDRHIDWLLKHHADALEGAMGINEGGWLVWKDGRPAELRVEAAEKGYLDLTLTARGTAGHASEPRPDNAVAAISRAVAKLADWKPPAQLQPVVRRFFEAREGRETGGLKAALRDVLSAEPGPGLDAAADRLFALDPDLGAMLRDTLVPTMLSAGYKSNVVPSEATAVLNARLLPGVTAASFAARVSSVIGDPKIEVAYEDQQFGPIPVVSAEGPLFDAVVAAAAADAPGAPVEPFMARWSTDSQYLRARGVRMLGVDTPCSVEDVERVHGKDERIELTALDWYAGFLWDVVRRLAVGP